MARLRRWHLAPAAVLLLAGVHGGAWLLATRQLHAMLDDLSHPTGGAGWRVSAEAAHASGWPWAATLDLDGVTLASTANPLTIHIEAARVTLTPRHPTLVSVALHGLATLGGPGLPAIAMEAERMEAEVTLTAPHPATITGRALRATTPAGPLGIARLDIQARPAPAPTAADIALALEASLAGIDIEALPPTLRGPLGPRIAGLTLSATLSGPIDLALPGPTRIARAWHDGGGRLTIEQFAVQWSRLDLDLQATIGLDVALQPEGSGTAGAGGIPETLDRAVGEGLIPPSSARAIKAVISLMTQTPDRKISVPLTLTNQTLSAARFPLLRLPDLRWP